MILYIFKTVPLDSPKLHKNATVLLIEDAVIAATQQDLLDKFSCESIYILAPDLEIRGLKELCLANIKQIDYDSFVNLVATSEKVIS